MQIASDVDVREQMRQPRVAELVANALRHQILSGQLQEGSLLPKQGDLLEEFRVSKPSMREALRILESEGLLTVRRGNVGGAVVHVPQSQNAAYALGLILKARNVTLRDVGVALKQLEPICASLCAGREDRHKTVLPVLNEIQQETRRALSDRLAVTRLARQFHEALVQHCGNETIITTVGAIESLWSSHEQAWAREATERGEFPVELASTALEVHDDLIHLIDIGDVDATAIAARNHLANTHFFGVSDDAQMLVLGDSASAGRLT
jgi:GntR family transcriptional regulator, transcriptional repressor for pyruvate dehydrogenase complex